MIRPDNLLRQLASQFVEAGLPTPLALLLRIFQESPSRTTTHE